MEDVILHILGSPITGASLLLALIAFVIFAFSRGWILVPYQVKLAIDAANSVSEVSNKRADEYKALYLTERERNERLTAALEHLLPVGENVNRIVEAIPLPAEGGQ
jgi:hypothetical protein